MYFYFIVLIKKQHFKKMEIIKEKELYERILKKVEEKRIAENLKPEKERTFWALPFYLVLPELGLSSQIAYDTRRFVNGRELGSSKTRPLHKRKLKELCDSIGIEVMSTYYAVKDKD